MYKNSVIYQSYKQHPGSIKSHKENNKINPLRMPWALHKKNNNNNKIINGNITRMFYASGIDSAFHAY